MLKRRPNRYEMPFFMRYSRRNNGIEFALHKFMYSVFFSCMHIAFDSVFNFALLFDLKSNEKKPGKRIYNK